MSLITAVAILNLKEQPNKLVVSGSVVTYNAEDKVELEFADPQGVVDTTLLLNVLVTNIEGHKKGSPKPFIYEQLENALSYDKVQLSHSSGDITVEVLILG